MNDEYFKQLALSAAPGMWAAWNTSAAEDVWASEPSTGKSLELATLAILYGALESLGAGPVIPSTLLVRPELYLVRNELPQHHGGQAGHSAAGREAPERFLAAFTPKLTFRIEGRSFAIFREGLPLHALAQYIRTRQLYKDRPDFVVIEGSFDVTSVDGITTVNAELVSGQFFAQVREVNSRYPQLVDWKSTSSEEPAPIAILECSWNKSESAARHQLTRYTELMPPIRFEQTLFVSAGIGVASSLQLLHVPRSDQRADLLIEGLADFLSSALGLRSD